MTQQNDLGAIQVSGQEMADLLAGKTDLEVARFINLSLLMHRGISEQDAGFDKVVCLNDAGLSKVASIIAALRPVPTADIRAALECARQAIEYSIDMGGADPGGVLLQALNRCDAAISPAGDTGREAEPVAWRYKCQDGSVVLMLKRLTDSQKARGYYTGEDGEDEVDGDEAVVGPFHWAEETPLYASPQPDARIGRKAYPFLAALSTTLKTMKSAHDNGGERLMSIWLDDVQAVEAAILSLTASATAGGWQDIATIEQCAKIAEDQALAWINGEASTAIGHAYQSACRTIATRLRALTARDAGSDAECTCSPMARYTDAPHEPGCSLSRAERAPTPASPDVLAPAQRLPE